MTQAVVDGAYSQVKTRWFRANGQWRSMGVLGRATAYWKAPITAGEYLRDLTGRGHDARFGSTGSARVFNALGGHDGYLRLPGVAGNFASVPDEAAFDVTDLDVRAEVVLNDPTVSDQAIVSRWGGASPRSFQFATGTAKKLQLNWSTGGATNAVISTTGMTIDNGERVQLRAVLDVDNGAGVYEGRFYTRDPALGLPLDDDTNWVQLGDAITGTATTSIDASDRPAAFGNRSDGAGLALSGRVFGGMLLDGIDGASVLDVDFTDLTDGATSFTAVTGQTVTINSTSGADSNDPKKLDYDPAVGRYVYLPGGVGNYPSAPDVNLLDADTAHLHQSIGGWANTFSASVTHSTADALFGAACGRVESTADGTVLTESSGVLAPASPGVVYAIALSAKAANAGMVGKEAHIRFNWYDGTKTLLSSSSYGTLTALSQTEWKNLTQTATSPANTAFMSVTLRIANTVAGNAAFFDRAVARSGSDTTFLPSTRIRSDLDLRVRVAADVWAASANQGLLGKWQPSGDQRSYYLQLTTTGALQLLASADGLNVASQVSADPPTTDGQDIFLRVTWRRSDGRLQFFSSEDGTTWTQIGADGSIAITSLFSATSPIEVGERAGSIPFKGKVLSAEFRDGIDGPVVASFDSTPLREPYATYTDPQGNTWTLNRSSSGRKLAVVDRTLLLFGTDDYLEVADHPDLDLTGDGTIVMLYRTYDTTPSGTQFVLAKRDAAGNNGYALIQQTGGSPAAVIDGGTATVVSGPANSDGVLSAIATRRDAGVVQTFTDGVGGTTATDASDVSNAQPLRVGSVSDGGSYADIEFIGAVIFKEPLSDADLVKVAAELKAA